MTLSSVVRTPVVTHLWVYARWRERLNDRTADRQELLTSLGRIGSSPMATCQREWEGEEVNDRYADRAAGGLYHGWTVMNS